jgi:hypothetical protein
MCKNCGIEDCLFWVDMDKKLCEKYRIAYVLEDCDNKNCNFYNSNSKFNCSQIK